MTIRTSDHDRRALPSVLPIFPLCGALLLPRGRLPLNIFEPRYLAMIEDSLGQGRMIGMIQPSEEEPGADPAICAVGCAGRITAFKELEDGRFLITLTGVSRFAVSEEMEKQRGYRRIVPNWEQFSGDLEVDDDVKVDRGRLIAGLRVYFRTQGIEANWDTVESSPDEVLVTSISMVCPFDRQDKQALLEAPNIGARAKLLTALIETAVLGDAGKAAWH